MCVALFPELCRVYQEEVTHKPEASGMSDKTDLTPEAVRALAEAEERRKKAKALELPTELGGRNGPEPVRYGDWERKGIAVDF